MFYRLNVMFNPSRGKAAMRAILCSLASIPFFLFGSVWTVIGLGLLFYALMYGCIWLYKYSRDQRLVEQAKLEAQQAPEAIAPPMTSPGSSWFGVPEPLDRQ